MVISRSPKLSCLDKFFHLLHVELVLHWELLVPNSLFACTNNANESLNSVLKVK